MEDLNSQSQVPKFDINKLGQDRPDMRECLKLYISKSAPQERQVIEGIIDCAFLQGYSEGLLWAGKKY